MAIYAIGDVQGCYTTLARLVERLRFDPAADRLWLVGDLVNRGPASADVLRFVRGLGNSAVTVLGNHDLHLVALHHGARRLRRFDHLDDVLAAPDREELVEWLRGRPLLHQDGGRILVHAGLWPDWSAAEARAQAGWAQTRLRGAHPSRTLAGLDGSTPRRFSDKLTGARRWRAVVQILTRMRTLHPRRGVCVEFTGPPAQAPRGCLPWFEVPTRRRAAQVVCGHWAALGLVQRPDVVALDTGCVWGGQLTAVRLEDGAVFQEPCRDSLPGR